MQQPLQASVDKQARLPLEMPVMGISRMVYLMKVCGITVKFSHF